MNDELSTTRERTPLDYFHFAMAFGGLILAAGGVVIVSVPTAVLGLLLVMIVVAYFAFED